MSTEAVTPPSRLGVDARGIAAFVDALENAPGVEPHSLQILRHGCVVAQGWWAPYEPDRPHLLYSLSKSFTSTALGFAVAEGLVDLDATVLSYFPEYDADVTDERARRMLVRHIAAMASGHREETLQRAEQDRTGDVVRGFLRIPPDVEPGTLFCYNQPCTFSLAAIVRRVSGQGLLEYLRPRLLDPLGIEADRIGWLRDGRGRELGFSGFHAPTDAVSKLGQFYLQRGRWRGEQLLPESWVAEATRSLVDSPGMGEVDWRQGYGFQFWMARHGYRGDGAYGQYCMVLPEQDAVVAITSQSPDMQAVVDAAWEHLLPALGDPVLPAGADEADEALARRLSQLSLPPAAAGELPQGEFAAAPDSEPATLTRVVVAGGAIVLHDCGDELRAEVGQGAWSVSGPLAVSGGGRRVEVVFVETPHRLHLDLDPVTGTFRGHWQTTPLHGAPLRTFRKPDR